VAVEGEDPSVIPVWASEAVDLITGLSPAVDLVARLGAEVPRRLDQCVSL
jgi:hypothetical protein